MSILEETVWITLNSRTMKHYEDLGYAIVRVKDKRGRLKVAEGTKIEVQVNDLPNMSNIKLTKICDNCERKTNKPQPYSAIIISRNNGDGKDYCDECKGHKVSRTKLSSVKYENSLFYKFPDIASEWDEQRNGLKASEVAAGSNKVFWWIGKSCGHKWNASPNTRTTQNQGYGCPYCSGRRVCEENCLLTVCPDVASEWNYDKNEDLTPYDVTYGSGQVVWWVGSKCNHEWRAVVYSRTGKDKNGCPICKMSKGEIKIYDYLTFSHINFKTQYTFNELLGINGFPLRFDFAIFSNNKQLLALIEYDGEFHFEERYEGDDHETTVIHDTIKNKYCEENNILLFRIPYWDFDNIEQILELELNNKIIEEAS